MWRSEETTRGKAGGGPCCRNGKMSQKSARGGGKTPSKGNKAPGGGKKAEDEREETLQAVVCFRGWGIGETDC